MDKKKFKSVADSLKYVEAMKLIETLPSKDRDFYRAITESKFTEKPKTELEKLEKQVELKKAEEYLHPTPKPEKLTEKEKATKRLGKQAKGYLGSVQATIDSITVGIKPSVKEIKPKTYAEKLKEIGEEKIKVPKYTFGDMQGYFNTVKELREGTIKKTKKMSKEKRIALAEQYVEEFEKFYIRPEYESLYKKYKYYKNLSNDEAKSRASKEIKKKWGIDYIGREMLGKEAEAKLYPGTEKTVKKLIKRNIGMPPELAILKAKSIEEGKIPVPEFIKSDKETKWDQYEVK